MVPRCRTSLGRPRCRADLLVLLLPLCAAGCGQPQKPAASSGAAWIAPPPGLASAGGEPDEEVKRLVVLITCPASAGAGILFGVDEDLLYVATAAHVVTPCAEGVHVQLRGQDQKVEAKVLRLADAPLDIAAIGVADPSRLGIDPNTPSFPRLGVSSVARRDAVYALGNPGGDGLSATSEPERITTIEGDEITFDSMLIRAGYSGGALVNDRSEIIGMIRADQPPTGIAISMARVLRTMQGWEYPVTLGPPFPRVSAGLDETCVASAEGTVRCFRDVNAQGTLEAMTLPGARFKSVTVGLHHTCSLAFDGAVSCWGTNNCGQLGNGTDVNSFDAETGVQQGSLVFASVAAGGLHTCALTTDGRAFCWGCGGEGRLGNNSGHDSRIPVPVSGGLRFTSITAGRRNTCGLTASGSVYCWGGMSGTGLLRSGTDPSNAWAPAVVPGDISFRSVSAGDGQICGLSADGAVYCWGTNKGGALGNGSTSEHELTPVRVSSALSFRAVTAGLGGHTCALSAQGQAFCWGPNDTGALGDGTTKSRSVPVPVAAGDLRFVELSAGYNHTCGVTTDRSIYCWGAAGLGSGTGTKDGSTTPVRVPLPQ